MAEIDPNNKLIKSFSFRHHRFDPETNHFRWFVVKCFDNEKEMNVLLEQLWVELEEGRLKNQTLPKEQLAGSIYDPEWAKENTKWSAYQVCE